MKDDLVEAYRAETLMQAQLLHDRLEAEGIRSFIENADSPLDGLVAAVQMVIVRVLPSELDRARRVVSEFESEGSA